MSTNVQLYEALKPHVGQEAAGMIAEIVPPARNLATQQDIARLEKQIADLRAEFSNKMLAYFIPLWVMMGSMSLAIVGLVATRA